MNPGVSEMLLFNSIFVAPITCLLKVLLYSLPLYCSQRVACELIITFTLSQKAKKKQVVEQISQHSAKLKENHAEELTSFGDNSINGYEKSNLDNLVK